MKPRSDSRLKTLTPERQAAIADYAHGHSLDDTVAWLKEDGFATSRTALSDFLSWFSLQQQLARNESTVETLLSRLKAQDPDYDPGELQRIGQDFFSALALQQQDPKTWYLTQQVNLKREALTLEGRRIALLEKKAAQADAAKGLLENKELSEADRIERMKAVFGISG